MAFDAELVGANIDYHGFGNAHMSYAANALQDITKLKASEANGGEGMNIVAVNMSFNKTVPHWHYGTISELSDGTYSAPKITNKVIDENGLKIQGDSKYWQVATDNDIIPLNGCIRPFPPHQNQWSVITKEQVLSTISII